MTLDVKLKASSTPAETRRKQITDKRGFFLIRSCLTAKLPSNNSLNLSSVCVCVTIAMMQVNVHIEDSVVFLPQPENSQHGIVHVAEA